MTFSQKGPTPKASRTYMFYKVKHQGVIVAQFASLNLAVHFVNSIPNADFIINYENRTNVWDTAKEGTPSTRIIQERVTKYNQESDARFNTKMEGFRIKAEEIAKSNA